MTNPGNVAVIFSQISVQKAKMGMYNRLTSNQLEFKSCLDKKEGQFSILNKKRQARKIEGQFFKGNPVG